MLLTQTIVDIGCCVGGGWTTYKAYAGVCSCFAVYPIESTGYFAGFPHRTVGHYLSFTYTRGCCSLCWLEPACRLSENWPRSGPQNVASQSRCRGGPQGSPKVVKGCAETWVLAFS